MSPTSYQTAPPRINELQTVFISIDGKYVKMFLALKLKKSRMLQIQGAEGEAIVSYCKPSARKVEDPANNGKMRYHRLS